MKEDGLEEKQEKNKERTAGIAGKRWINRGIYGSRDVPVRILDGLILGIIVTVIILVIVFAVNGGYNVTFDTGGGSSIAAQRLRHGNAVEQPDTPEKPGYEFLNWVTSEDESLAEEWDFSEDKVEGDLTLYAVWRSAEITVKFDMDGGNFGGAALIPDKKAVFGEAYGELPIPSKEGYRFDGWEYGGTVIGSDTVVATSGEHVLTARWIPA